MGSAVPLKVLRDGRTLTLNATLHEQPRQLDGGALDPRLAGARLAELSETQRQALGRGVRVEAVAAGSRAAQNGLQPGDIIVATNAGPADDLGSLRGTLSRRPERLVLRILRGNVQGTLSLR